MFAERKVEVIEMIKIYSLYFWSAGKKGMQALVLSGPTTDNKTIVEIPAWDAGPGILDAIEHGLNYIEKEEGEIVTVICKGEPNERHCDWTVIVRKTT